MFPTLFRKEIDDEFSQENFKRIGDYFAEDPVSNGGFKFFEVSIPSAVTGYQHPHSLGYQPKDVILLHNSTNATVTFNYLSFDKTFISITTSGATVLRFLLGRVK